MKSLVLALTVLFATSAHATSFQTHEEHAIQAFNNSPAVKELTAAAKAAGLNHELAATAILLKGQCGFAGCARSYLVSKVVQRKGTNDTISSVTAIVDIPAIGETKVSKAVDADTLEVTLFN